MLFDEMDQEVVMFFQYVFNALNFEDLLNDHEDEGIGEFVDWTGEFIDWVARVQDVLATMQHTPSLFKNLTNFTLMEFEELTTRVVPIISSHARSTCEPFWPSKLHD
jgi:hypothetical protein